MDWIHAAIAFLKSFQILLKLLKSDKNLTMLLLLGFYSRVIACFLQRIQAKKHPY